MNTSKGIFRLSQVIARATARNSSTKTTPSPRYAAMKAKQKAMGTQGDDDILVHVKMGVFDRILYVSTAALILTGTAGAIQTLYVCAVK